MSYTANSAQSRLASSGSFPWPSGLVALWDFQNDAVGGTTVTSKVGGADQVLTALAGKKVVKDGSDVGPFGSSLVLDGSTVFSKAGPLGALDISTTGDQVTVIAWVKDSSNTHDTGGAGYSFRAGSHVEDTTTPARQYGLYFDGYAWIWSNGHLTPHIGAQDGPSPGYIFNRDQASSKRQYFTGTGQGQWHMEAMTFDGHQAIAYVDGITDIWQAVPEPPASAFGGTDTSANGQVVDRNPFILNKGINRSSTTKYFSIGAAITNLSPVSGGNFTTGKLGGIAVWNRALTASEIMQVRMMTLKANEPISKFGLEVNSTGNHAVNETAWFARAGALCADVSNLTSTGAEYSITRPASGSTSYLTKTSTGIGAAWIALTGLNSSQVRKVTFDMLSAATTSAAQRLLVKVGSQWWASNSTFATASTHSGDTDWTGAETQSINVNWDIGNWLPVTLQDNTTPTTTTYTNMALNPELSTNSTNWFKSGASTNATAARTAVTGGFAWILTWSGTGSVGDALGGLTNTGIGAITAGQNYCTSMQVTCSKAQALQLEVQWYNGSSAYISSTFGGIATTVASTALTLAASGVAPTGAVSALVRVVTAAGGVAWASADTLAITKCIVVQGTLLPAYFDGDTASASWTGTPGASSSTLSTTALPVTTNIAYNPVLKSTSTGWFTSGSVAHATGARVASGPGFVWRSTWTGTDAAGTNVVGMLNTSIGAITAGQNYCVSMLVNPSRAQRFYLVLDWYNVSSTLISSTTGGVVVAGKNTPTTIPVSGVAPTGATQVLVRLVASSAGRSWISGDTLDVGSLMVVQGTSLPPSTVEGSATTAAGTLSLGGATNTSWVGNDLITAVGFLSSGGDGSAVRVSNLQLFPTGGVT